MQAVTVCSEVFSRYSGCTTSNVHAAKARDMSHTRTQKMQSASTHCCHTVWTAWHRFADCQRAYSSHIQQLQHQTDTGHAIWVQTLAQFMQAMEKPKKVGERLPHSKDGLYTAFTDSGKRPCTHHECQCSFRCPSDAPRDRGINESWVCSAAA